MLHPFHMIGLEGKVVEEVVGYKREKEHAPFVIIQFIIPKKTKRK